MGKSSEYSNIYNDRARKYTANDAYFKTIETERAAYWLGFIEADGCVYKQENTFRFAIALASKDLSHLYVLRNDLNASYPISDRTQIVRGKKYTSHSLVINSKSFCENLMSQGVMPNKSLSMPSVLPPSHLTRHYLRGVYDGDGSVKVVKGKVHKIILTGGKDFLLWVKEILTDQAGIAWTPRCLLQCSNSKANQLCCYGQSNFGKIKDYFYTDASVYLARKAEPLLGANNIWQRLS